MSRLYFVTLLMQNARLNEAQAAMNCRPPGSSVHGISQLEYWSGLPFPFPGGLPDSRIHPATPLLKVWFLITEPPGEVSEEPYKALNWGKILSTIPPGKSGTTCFKYQFTDALFIILQSFIPHLGLGLQVHSSFLQCLIILQFYPVYFSSQMFISRCLTPTFFFF